MEYTIVRDGVVVGRYTNKEDRDDAIRKYGGIKGEYLKEVEA